METRNRVVKTYICKKLTIDSELEFVDVPSNLTVGLVDSTMDATMGPGRNLFPLHTTMSYFNYASFVVLGLKNVPDGAPANHISVPCYSNTGCGNTHDIEARGPIFVISRMVVGVKRDGHHQINLKDVIHGLSEIMRHDLIAVNSKLNYALMN